jgi:hypothetical protein
MSTQILPATTFEVNPETTEFPHVCRDCGEVLTPIVQQLTRGSVTLVTCWNRQCDLATVTLSVEQYNGLSETQLEAYRQMTRARAVGLHSVGQG